MGAGRLAPTPATPRRIPRGVLPASRSVPRRAGRRPPATGRGERADVDAPRFAFASALGRPPSPESLRSPRAACSQSDRAGWRSSSRGKASLAAAGRRSRVAGAVRESAHRRLPVRRDDLASLSAETTLRRTRPGPRGARAAMCVQNADDHCVLQFTLIIAAGCVLHRRTSRVIHRQELSLTASRARGGWFVTLRNLVRHRDNKRQGHRGGSRTGAGKTGGLPAVHSRPSPGFPGPPVVRQFDAPPPRPRGAAAALPDPGVGHSRLHAEDSTVADPTGGGGRPGTSSARRLAGSVMILPQVHLRKPCYDFYFL